MALASTALLAPYDMAGTREDLSDVVSEILLQDTNLLSRIGISGEATAINHQWVESSLNPATVTDNETGGLDAAGSNVDLVLATGTAIYVRIGALLKNTAQGKTELLQVTDISSDTLTVTRGYGSTSPQVHDSGSTWSIVSMPVQSGTDATTDRSTVRSAKANYCQQFERSIQIAGDAQAVLTAGVPDELAYQTYQRMLELMTELDRTIIMSVISSSAGSDSVYRTLKGLIEWLTATGGNSNSASESISSDVINNMFQQIYDDGGGTMGANLVLACNQNQMRKISAFDVDKVQVVPGPGTAGRYVTQFLTDLGTVLPIVVDRWIPSDTAMILDLSRVKVVPLRGRGFGVQEIAKTGDSFKKQIIGDYTLECRNALQAHAIHTNLTA